MSGIRAGFYGKLPSRGDFLRSGLPAETVAVLDAWIARNLRTQQEQLGDAFDAVWEAAPHWRFMLTPGRLDPHDAASGLWVPSIDRAGRCFPLVIVVLHTPDVDCRPLLEALEPLAIATVQDDHEPEELQTHINEGLRAQPLGYITPTADCWWYRRARTGSTMALHAVFPEGETFAALLRRTNGEMAS